MRCSAAWPRFRRDPNRARARRPSSASTHLFQRDLERALPEQSLQVANLQAQVDTLYVKSGIRSINQVRATLAQNTIDASLVKVKDPAGAKPRP